jgi:hypothetical protein
MPEKSEQKKEDGLERVKIIVDPEIPELNALPDDLVNDVYPARLRVSCYFDVMGKNEIKELGIWE